MTRYYLHISFFTLHFAPEKYIIEILIVHCYIDLLRLQSPGP